MGQQAAKTPWQCASMEHDISELISICRAHGFRFDHLSFAANHRRSEKARNFLDMLRHSQMSEVFINERLALAAGGYKTNDAFEAKISYLQGKRSKVLGRLVAQAGAKSVSNLSAVLSRTSTLVKVRAPHTDVSENTRRQQTQDDLLSACPALTHLGASFLGC